MTTGISFSARIVTGEGIGASLGTPTLNLDLSDVPSELDDGVYAVRADGNDAVMHYGERNTLGLGRSCEVHLLERQAVSGKRQEISIDVIGKLREVEKFGGEEELKEQIAKDIGEAKKILQ